MIILLGLNSVNKAVKGRKQQPLSQIIVFSKGKTRLKNELKLFSQQKLMNRIKKLLLH